MKEKNLICGEKLLIRLLNGAVIKWYNIGDYISTILIKNNLKENCIFDYEIYQTIYPGKMFFYMDSFNETPKNAIKKVTREHYSEEVSIDQLKNDGVIK